MLQAHKNEWRLSDEASIWKTLWRIKASPKTLNLLQQKHVNIRPLCPVCSTDVETIEHAIFLCPFVVQCCVALNKAIRCALGLSFSQWLENTLALCNKEQQAEIVTLCWAIWRARNEVVCNKKSSTVNRVVAETKQYLTQWKLAQSRSTNALLQPQADGDGIVVWVKPQPDTVKVTVDAAIFENRDEIGFGVVARDSTGALIQAKIVIKQGLISPVLAEAMAVKEGLSWIDTLKWSRSVLESDCLVVVQAIRGLTPMRSHFG
ncbi:uncharacterized protein LOC141690503 [Apium graveolens]|uniref:uncharacterized protein LOC141690503 n=1 Tax=Apium graveolens TaxID=4045 RepID=UPI003D7B966E